MVSRSSGDERSHVNRLSQSFDVTFEPVYLSKKEDDARIKRLSKQILACIERTREEARRSRKRDNSGADVLKKDFDEIFGLND